MRICLVSPYFHPHIGGVESHVYELARYLSRRGHVVEVISSNSNNAATQERRDGFTVKRAKCHGTPFNTPLSPGIKNLVMEGDYDIVHVHYPPPLTEHWAFRGLKKKHVPLVLTYHCDLELRGGAKKLIGLYDAMYGNRVRKMADRVIVTTPSYAATSRRVWNVSPSVVPNAVNAKNFNPKRDGSEIREAMGIKPDQYMVLFVGRLVPHKAVQFLIEAAKSLDKDTRIVVVGTGPYEEELRRRSVSMGVKDNIIFAGAVENSRLPLFYAACDLFVLPSISRLEAFGIVLLEAMATGKPVIASGIPGVKEVITPGQEGLVAEPMNPDDLAEKIRWMKEHPKESEEMGRNGRARVEKEYTWEEVCSKIEAIYKELVFKGRVQKA
ncbi:MAG: glycosyltransferase family 4 protein [Candidatus Thermoplasmatota archaeon]|nr:glycosyltransferase family 4 protein [Candidatus Thermoplasmatota archaeon]